MSYITTYNCYIAATAYVTVLSWVYRRDDEPSQRYNNSSPRCSWLHMAIFQLFCLGDIRTTPLHVHSVLLWYPSRLGVVLSRVFCKKLISIFLSRLKCCVNCDAWKYHKRWNGQSWKLIQGSFMWEQITWSKSPNFFVHWHFDINVNWHFDININY